MFFFWSEVSLHSTTQKIEISRKIFRSALDILKRTLCISSNAFRRPKNAVFCLCTLPYLLYVLQLQGYTEPTDFYFLGKWRSEMKYIIYITCWAFVSSFCCSLFVAGSMFLYIKFCPAGKRMMDLDVLKWETFSAFSKSFFAVYII